MQYNILHKKHKVQVNNNKIFINPVYNQKNLQFPGGNVIIILS